MTGEDMISRQKAIMAVCAAFRDMNTPEDKRTILDRCKANLRKISEEGKYEHRNNNND